MTHEEIIRWFRRFKYDPIYRHPNGSHSVPLANLAEWAGIPRANLYNMLNGSLGISKNYHDRMVAAIEAVQLGLRWKRRKARWEINDPKFERLPRHDYPKFRGQQAAP